MKNYYQIFLFRLLKTEVLVKAISKLISLNGLQLRFILIGGINTVFGLSIFPILYFTFGGNRKNYMLILIISYFMATMFSFLTNKIIVFKTKNNLLVEYIKFMSFQLGHLVLNLIALPLIVELFGYSPVNVQPIFVLFVVFTSYFWYKYIAFTGTKT